MRGECEIRGSPGLRPQAPEGDAEALTLTYRLTVPTGYIPGPGPSTPSGG